MPVFTPDDIRLINECTLQFHFWQQGAMTDDEPDHLHRVVLAAIQHLHAAGGPYRLNLPATLRHLNDQIPAEHQQAVPFVTTARQLLANYHRRLRQEWPKVIASREVLGLNMRLNRETIRCTAVIDRLDQELDGGVTVIELVTATEGLPQPLNPNDVDITLRHALAAAAYPQKRPVRIKQLWLYHDQEVSLELTETQYRQTLAKIKQRVWTWLEGEILARPGLHCESCPFKRHGCPIYVSA